MSGIGGEPKGDGNLRERLLDPGYTPKRRDLGALVTLWQASEGDLEKKAQQALLRRPDDLFSVLGPRFEDASERERVAFLRLLGRIPATPELRAFFFATLSEPSHRVRREAIVQIGKARASEEEEAVLLRHHEKLVAAGDTHADALAEVRSLVEALGKSGGEKSLEVVRHGDVTEGIATYQKAAVRLARTSLRESAPGSIQVDLSWDACTMHFYCRPGLESLLAEELRALGVLVRFSRHAVVVGETSGPLSHLAKARLFTHLGFVADLAARDIPALVSAVAGRGSALRASMTALTEGPLRYRLSFADGRHRRGLVWEAASEMAAAWPEATNDPTATLWDLSVGESNVVAIPKGGWDTRFAYERPSLPASTHPTLAAALTWVGSKNESDVVWDPFVGAGTELRERAMRGPYKRLIGTDVSQGALDLAAATLRGLNDVELSLSDACDAMPKDVSLILTNPPMGRRIRTEGTKNLLVRFVAQAALVLRPLGELVWYAPFPEVLSEAAHATGLVKKRGIPVDLGGFEVELQHFVKRAR